MSRAKPGWELGNMADRATMLCFCATEAHAEDVPGQKKRIPPRNAPRGFCFKGGNLHDRKIIMPQLEFRAIRAVTPRWRLDIMGRWVSTAGGRKTTYLRRCGVACRHVCFLRRKRLKQWTAPQAWGHGRKKSDPPRNCPRGAGSFVRGGNLLSHTRVQYHRRGRA